MRSPLFTVGRRAGVLAAATLVSLTTAACGPADLQLGAAGGAGPTDATSQAETDPSLPLGEAAATPGGTVPTPSPSPTTPDEPVAQVPVETPVEPPVDVPADAPGEPSTGDADLPEAEGVPGTGTALGSGEVPETEDVPADTGSVAAQAAAAGGTGSRSADSSSGQSATGRAPATAPAGAPAAAPAAGASTGGSGGTYTDQPRRSFRAGNGQTGQYLVYAGGIDPTRPVGLVVYVDGTGEYGVDNPSSSYALGGSSGLVATGKARNAITLAVESPNQSCECWHTGDTTAYADFLAQLIEEQLASYPVTDVWLAGFSSGAQEITRFLVPRHPELMRLGGGWVVFGGGGPPADGGAAVTAARMGGVRGHWYTGTADTAVPLTASWGAQAGERFYAGRGVVASHEWPAGVGHGLDGQLGRTVGQVIDAP